MTLVRAAQQISSSSTTTPPACSFDVFLSFRGEDTRKNFTDHLYKALVNAGFRTFRDDDELERGEDINPGLQQAIQQSRCSVIVFSKDYASSRWCLDELLIILQRKSTSNHMVLPVFYDTDPSQVRKQTGSFAKAFATHQKTRPSKKVEAWRVALAQVADLAGMVLQNQADGYESKFITKIIKVIAGKLSRTPLSVVPNLIGIHFRAESINSWVQDESHDVGVLVVFGMHGIGKTTIAEIVYNSNFGRFQGTCFLGNINEISEQPNGLVQIQMKLLSDVLKGRKVNINSISDGITKIEYAISSKRVLIVLDDVDRMDQLDAVLRMKDRFYPGSKIIITTSNARLVKAHQATEVHNVEPLNYIESLRFFSWHAFGQDHPIKGYLEHSAKVVSHSGGLPLALQVFGSSLMGEAIAVWESALQKLEAIPHVEIMAKLRVSYDLLDRHDQELFLHIACFFVGKEKDHIVRILDGCDFYATIGLTNLMDRCLVTIDRENKVQMHVMIRDMGRGIARLASEEPGKRSRLWHHKDSFKVLREKNGTETIEGVVLKMYGDSSETPNNSNETLFDTSAFARMEKLRLLHLSHVQLSGCYDEFPTGLRWLCWFAFPLDSIPISFPLENLVVLEMHNSRLIQIWRGTKCFPSLKILDLSHSPGITEITDFSPCANLEKLILVDCASMIDVHESIGNLNRLVYLNLKDCKSLRRLPKNILKLNLLETLVISGCTNLNESSMEMMRSMESLKVLEIDGVSINQLAISIGEVKSWPGRSSYIWSYLPCCVVSVSVSGCNISDDAFPTEFGNLSSILERLNLGNNPICSLPDCVKGLTRLVELSFKMCSQLKTLVDLPKVRGDLDVSGCTTLEKITFQSSLCFPNEIYECDNDSLVEVEYLYKLEPIGKVNAELLKLLGLCNLDLDSLPTIKMRHPLTYDGYLCPVQGLYQHGFFSTFLPGNEVPGQFSHKSKESSSISLAVPLLHDLRIRGLNIFIVYANSENGSPSHDDIPLIIRVRTKNKGQWTYGPTSYGIPGEGEDMIWLSYWNLDNKLQGGDVVAVSVFAQHHEFQVKEWGVQVVRDEQEENMSSTLHKSLVTIYPSDWSTWITWLNSHFEDSDEDTDNKEEQQDEDHTIAAATCTDGSNNQWKMSKESSKKDSDDDDDAGDDSNGHDASIKPEGDVYNVEQDGNQSISTTTKKSGGNVSAESSKKRNETLTDSAPLCVNDEVTHSVAKDVANEELKQFFEILNNMEDIDDDSYCKAVNHFHSDATWGKMFVLMPDKRRKAFILKL